MFMIIFLLVFIIFLPHKGVFLWRFSGLDTQNGIKRPEKWCRKKCPVFESLCVCGSARARGRKQKQLIVIRERIDLYLVGIWRGRGGVTTLSSWWIWLALVLPFIFNCFFLFLNFCKFQVINYYILHYFVYKMRFYARFTCGNPYFHTSWYKISYDTRAKNFFLTSVITSLTFGSCCKLTLARKSFIALVS